MRILKIAFTGGPSAGKSTMFSRTKKYLIEQGFKVIEIPESATELIEMDTRPESFTKEELKPQLSRDSKVFQDIVYDYQRTKERCAYKSMAYNAHHDLCIILCDRGILDNIAYVEKKEDFEEIFQRYGDSEIQLLDSYDLVIKLTTLAITKPECYEAEFNGIAREDPEFAKYLDDRTTKAWLGHPNMHIIDTGKTKDEVSEEIIQIINNLIHEQSLNETDSLREEYSIDTIDLSRYNKINSRKIHVKKIYIVDTNQNTYDISRRELDGNISFLVSKNGAAPKHVTKEEVEYLLSLTHDLLPWEEYDEISIYENMRLYTIKDYGDEQKLVVYDKDLILPEGIKLKKEKAKKLQK